MKPTFSYFEYERDFSQSKDYFSSIMYESNYPSHFHQKIELTYVLKGTVDSVVADKEYHLEQDEILFVPSFYPHSYSTSEDVERIVFIPDRSFMLNQHYDANNLNFSPLNLQDKEFNKKVILPILNESLVANKKTHSLVMLGITNLIIGKLLEHYPTSNRQDTSNLSIIIDVLNYIDQHYKEDITLDSLSEKFGYNKFYFSKLFNKYTRTNINKYVNNLRIIRITRFDFNKIGRNMTKTAFDYGFNSMPSFYRAFKDVLGCTPKEYFKRD